MLDNSKNDMKQDDEDTLQSNNEEEQKGIIAWCKKNKKPLIVGACATIGGIVLYCLRYTIRDVLWSTFGSLRGSTEPNEENDGMDDETEELFLDVPMTRINEIAQQSYRGVEARKEGDSILYLFRSQSGRTINGVRIMADENNELNIYKGNNGHPPNSAKKFLDRLQEEIEMASHSDEEETEAV